jgi:hypothetical protein
MHVQQAYIIVKGNSQKYSGHAEIKIAAAKRSFGPTPPATTEHVAALPRAPALHPWG